MTIFAAAGAKLFIGGILNLEGEDLEASDFTSQVWKEIKNLESIGTIGDSKQIITHESMGSARTHKLVGTRNAGQMNIVAAADYSDPGQIALLAAEKIIGNYAFKIVLPDAPPGVGSTPSSRLFIGIVASATEDISGANNVIKLNSSVEINSNIVRINAATA